MKVLVAMIVVAAFAVVSVLKVALITMIVSPPPQVAESTSFCSHPPTCKLPQVLYTATCRCVCPQPPHKPCIPPKFFNTKTCQCECLKDKHGQCSGQDEDTGVLSCRYATTAAQCSKAKCTESKVYGKHCV